MLPAGEGAAVAGWNVVGDQQSASPGRAGLADEFVHERLHIRLAREPRGDWLKRDAFEDPRFLAFVDETPFGDLLGRHVVGIEVVDLARNRVGAVRRSLPRGTGAEGQRRERQ